MRTSIVVVLLLAQCLSGLPSAAEDDGCALSAQALPLCTDWVVGKILVRIGLTGVEKAGPFALTGQIVGASVACRMDSGGSH